MATDIQTTETLRTTEKTEFFKLFSVPWPRNFFSVKSSD